MSIGVIQILLSILSIYWIIHYHFFQELILGEDIAKGKCFTSEIHNEFLAASIGGFVGAYKYYLKSVKIYFIIGIM